ncbi:uncharacterized protein LOC118491185 [Helianthus annuus]|uniref:uncharacterized protein LOC118491185 n=1 Tax=Helianthus annuus TaxID=4232 RepID=UPI0016533E5B|nr:uncharacterized protein LOC118491185 [Helianthus annuus]
MPDNQTVHQRSTSGFTANSPITIPEITNDKSWKIPSYIMTAINNSCQFHGRDDEDALAHINRLTRLCSTFGIEGVNLDARFLQVFPFSLAGRTATWLDSQPAVLQRQVGDIAHQLQERPPGQFSGNTKPNPSGTLKAISTRSGRTLGEVVRPERVEVEDEDPIDEEIEMEVPEIFKQLRINLPFVEALQSMPKYAKFLKDLLTCKDRLGEVSNIPLSGGCSAVVLNKVSEKLTDPGLFTIPCLFGSDTECRALADLGASINLMPYSMYERLGLGELSPTRMSLSLADRSVKYPRGIIENLLVKVDKFIFPVDFVVLDMEADEKVPIILGCPFLCTAKAIIDVFDGKITLQVESFLSCVDHWFDYISGADLVESRIDEVVEKVEEVVSESEEVEENEWVPEVLELSEVKSELESEGSEFPIIISSKLEEGEKGRLLEVLRVNREAISWRLSVIKGISPAYCTHQILMEDDYKPVVQPQRRLNPNMQEVVKKEVLKLLDAGVIYPISDSPWVSPTQVVPKKGGMTVIINEKNELIPSRTVTGWRVCIDYRKLNDATRKDHFPLPFIHQMMLKRCIETNLLLNLEKCHFMVTEGIVLGHKVSREGIEVDRAKIDTISRLPPPTSVKSVRSFLGHAGFYRRFIKDFSKITRHMTRLLEKDVPFVFDEECIKAFDFLKEKLVSAPILVSPNWSLPFELMCDASDYAVGAVLGQRINKHFHPIYYASKTLNDAQENYTTTEKELLAVVFAFDKFRSYLVLSKTTVFIDHATLQFLFQKKDAKPRLIRWILFLSEFAIEIKDKKGAENVDADHLSRLEDPKREEVREDSIGDTFPHETIDFVSAEVEGLPWFSDLANYLATGDLVRGMSYQQKKKLLRDARKYIRDDPYLFRIGGDRVLRRCVSREDGLNILRHVHEGLMGGHHGPNVTAQKVFDSGFYWPTVVKDAVEYILVAIDYVSKSVEAQALPTNDARVVVRFLKKLFTRFGVPKAIISDRGTHFCNSAMEKALARYGVTHRLSTAYHSQTSGQVENANRGVKRILEKTVGKSRKD